ncbi:hypothetical protein GF358_00170 [Candidatus Woesearchaeota archaeon]|nr:hypothetical protein [Candidatus Woesearchaeota archaeon]
MDKKVLVGVTMLLFLIAGLMVVSANLSSNTVTQETPEDAPPTCGQDSCGFECGGDCGIPSCGCGG